MKSDARRKLVWGAAAAAVALLMAWILWPHAIPVDIVEATLGPLVVTLDEEGETRVRERFSVSAPVDGRLLRIELEPGESVQAGQTVLATMQPREAVLLDPRSRAEAEALVRAREAELEQARHERESARAELVFAERDCERARRLEADDVLSAERLEAAELAERRSSETLEAAEHAVAGAAHRLASARARLLDLGDPTRRGDDPISIHAPVDGVVLRRMHESETVVVAGEPLLEIGDATDLEIVADYLSRDAVQIRPGAPARVERWGGDRVLEARVRRVEPSGYTKVSALGVEEKRVDVVLELVTPYQERTALADGFRVETRIVVEECAEVLRVPSGALFRRGEEWAVFAVEDGRARIRSVQVGVRTPAHVEITEGLAPGARVIAHPGDTVVDGVRVTARSGVP